MRENLIPFPYISNFPKDVVGVHYELNADGSISAKGTATTTYGFVISTFELEAGTYALSGADKTSGRPRIRLAVNDTLNNGSCVDGVIKPFTITAKSTIQIQLQMLTVNEAVDTVFRPMLIKVFDYTQPKTDWTAEDYFNTTDYERIVGNIIETQDFASSLYSGYDIAEMMESVNYESIPHADTWNVISENIGIINQHTYNLPLQPSEVYVDNGYSPNYEEFNRWESNIERLMTTLRVEASTIPRLAKTLGRPMIGNR